MAMLALSPAVGFGIERWKETVLRLVTAFLVLGMVSTYDHVVCR